MLLDPIAASDLLTIEFALDVRSDHEFGGIPEAIHLTAEVFGDLVGGSQRSLPSRDPALPAAGHRAPVIPVPG